MGPSVLTQAVPSLAHSVQGAPFEAPLAPGDAEWEQHIPAELTDAKDMGTGDSWVPRDPRIVRLTGRHPLNCEPRMQDLMAAGFITPPPIHYVRNHGAVPKIMWSEHRVAIGGLVSKPMTLTMEEILQLPSVTLPVTLVCAGNRRKEENMLKKSIGFNWGPCAVSTSYWTGVRLRDLLILAGAKGPAEGGSHVCFRGPKGELPKGADGSYGTSLTWAKAMDPASDVIVAYKQNGRWLTPDHGFPIRIIIPGFIGGRMVKWLEEITVEAQESQSHYHFFDNRVLPSNVDQELANAEGWWYKPDYIINDLNINSAVASPWHDEVLMLGNAKDTYTVKGYAYAGGGRKIIRVEISLDLGVTWRLSEIRRSETPTEYGKHWCWVHWDIEVPVFDFFRSKEMLLRAWDDSMNTQPAMITWNVMGMLNNCHFRVLIHPHSDASGNMGVRFQHPAPVEVGELGSIGWREEANLMQQALEAANLMTAPGAVPVKKVVEANGNGVGKDHTSRGITMEEVGMHKTEESAWFVHEGMVYDATPFLDEHPGGADSILIVTGDDATEDFNAIHSKKAKAMLEKYYVGHLIASDTSALAAAAALATVATLIVAAETNPPTLHAKNKVSLPLIERIEVSHNTRIFRFALPTPSHRLGLPVGRHLLVYGTVGAETVARAYTPISSDEDLGHLDLLIKVYRAGQNVAFPEGGKMSQLLDNLAIGDCIQVKGPTGHFIYEGKGNYLLHSKHKGHAKHLNMLAGGTGITPMYSVIKAVLKDALDPTRISLLFANQTVADILLKDELEALAKEHPDRFQVCFICSTGEIGKCHVVGRITENLMRERLFAADPATGSSLGLMCGPQGLLDNVCTPGLLALGFPKELHVSF
eukprot:CAMPEP_0119101232 /NCGR_PEP_ID=MMETSP1180-20130426/336_1 /TAXON_ID=3052 ORGANISM="Chlamydomonas cf sp, Strain CCMP681" /NCGR_SAMPLE_ID=MMETSP1180 /ASSEMBLY_ACC=CAM_ASM_000741 /LENGTH=868 /DNA_ID=CAMNT_0007085319 /DNA_START=39 /DNA_END=2645 /DNA_ORIENTATION=+